MSESRPLEGVRVIVTGASRGLGRAIAIACANSGATVGINYYRSDAEARRTADSLGAQRDPSEIRRPGSGRRRRGRAGVRRAHGRPRRPREQRGHRPAVAPLLRVGRGRRPGDPDQRDRTDRLHARRARAHAAPAPWRDPQRQLRRGRPPVEGAGGLRRHERGRRGLHARGGGRVRPQGPSLRMHQSRSDGYGDVRRDQGARRGGRPGAHAVDALRDRRGSGGAGRPAAERPGRRGQRFRAHHRRHVLPGAQGVLAQRSG